MHRPGEKKRQPDDCGGGASGQHRLVRQKEKKRQPDDYGGDASGQRRLVQQKKRNVNRMTVAEMPPASAVSFDKKNIAQKLEDNR